MAETESHKKAKGQAAGRSGKTEVPLSRGRRVDAATSSRATEVERSGDPAKLQQAARRLRASRKPQKVLQVSVSPETGRGFRVESSPRSLWARRRFNGREATTVFG